MDEKISLAVCITVHNRHETAAMCITEWKKHLPEHATLFVVDDGSTKPFSGASFRFETAQGIPVAKNKCLELAERFDHIFLADDDCWPIMGNWWQPYVNSGQPHLCFTFDRLKDGRQNGNKKILSKNGLVSYSNPCGCLLYFKKEVLRKVGGFDTRFDTYFYEHVELSNRIFNAGLTLHRYQDVPDSLSLFYSMDWAKEIKSSVQKERGRLYIHNKKHFQSVLNSKAFVPYKQLPDVVITTYFTTITDTQRDKWVSDWGHLYDLIESLSRIGNQRLVILTDTLPPKKFNARLLEFIQVRPESENPYIARWIAIRDYLQVSDYNMVFCVDATDVKMLRSPFLAMEYGKLYTGDEAQHIHNPWLVKHHPAFKEMYQRIPRRPLLNAGLCGGHHNMVYNFVNLMCLQTIEPGLTDMALFNYVAYRFFEKEISHGPHVNTVFKSFSDNGKAWWQHK